MADFGDPVHSSTTYRLCLYDASGTPQPLLEADVPAGGTCGLKPCWRTTSASVAYRNKAGDPDGVIKLTLKAGVTGRAMMQATARGTNLRTPALPLTLPVTVQLVVGDGVSSECWESTFTAAAVNAPSRLSATGP